jgi:putative DNA primase/helicase
MKIPITYKKKSHPVLAPTGPSQSDQERMALDAQLLPHAQALLQEWCGETVVNGHEITMRNPMRVDDSLGSFKFNAESGAWSDFAAPDFRGYGLTLLYCHLKHVPIAKAIAEMREATQDEAFKLHAAEPVVARIKPTVEAVDPNAVIKPPDVHPDLGYPSMTWEYRDADNRLSFYVYRFDIDGKKETRPVAWSAEKNAWLWQYPSPPCPLYHLPDLLERAPATVIVTEGEKAADAAQRQFTECVAITSACGSGQALRTDWSHLKGRSIIIAPDKDAPGKHYALSVAGAALAHGAKSVGVIDVWSLPVWGEGDDLADHEVPPEFLEGAKDVHEFFEATELEPHIVKACAALGRGDLDRQKKALAESLGIGVRTFEGLVKEARVKECEADTIDPASNGFEDDQLEPWEESVDGEHLYAELVALIERYVILSGAQAAAVACWIVFSYGFDAMRICPQMLINSPSKRCGKSTLLELIMSLVRRPLPAANISSAAVFRSIDSWKPTLLIDEADTFLNSNGNEEITGILNSGHNRSLAYVVRTQEIDGEHTPVRFSTFCPKVIAMIKAPADTIVDRSIVITLVRKLAIQRVDAMPIDAVEQMKDTRRRILRWVADNLETVKFDMEATPSMSNDRARQNWAVLVAFALALGPLAHAAVLKAASDLADTSDIEENIEVDLLADLRDLTEVEKRPYIESAVIVQDLLKLKERPWGEINRGKELTENKLARLLKPFKLSPEKFREGIATHRGYSVAALKAVFDRYLMTARKETA